MEELGPLHRPQRQAQVQVQADVDADNPLHLLSQVQSMTAEARVEEDTHISTRTGREIWMILASSPLKSWMRR